MAISATTVATSIAGLSVAGVTIKDLTSIPEKVNARDCPIVFPRPDGFLSGLEMEVNSFGSLSAKKTVRYVLSYTYLHTPVGAGRGLFDVYQDMVAKALAFIDAVIANDALTGSIDIQPSGIAEFGPVADPSGAVFHGSTLTFNVMEFIN